MTPIHDLFAQFRASAEKCGISLPMAKLNDAIARCIFNRPYSAVIAAEKAGRRPPIKWPPQYIDLYADRYRVDEDTMTEALVDISPYPTLNDAGFPQEWRRTLLDAKHREGLVLICAPTGHGKTTTQWAIAKSLANEIEMQVVRHYTRLFAYYDSYHEEPDAFWHRMYTFDRQPRPPLLLINEIRNSKCAATAIELARTNLVLATIFAADPIEAFRRVVAYAAPLHGGKINTHEEIADVWLATLAQRVDKSTGALTGHLLLSPHARSAVNVEPISANADFPEDGQVHTWVCEDILHAKRRPKNTTDRLTRSLGM